MTPPEAGAGTGPPDEIKRLLEANRRWAEARRGADPDAFRALCSTHRPPFCTVGCCDARTPLDVITGASPGHLFIHRNVANQVRLDDAAVGASLEFSLGVLEVRHLVVIGHTRCGGVQAALGPELGGDLGAWIAPVREIAREHRDELEAIEDPVARTDALAERNVVRQLENALRHPAVRRRLEDEERPLRLHGWMFRLESGQLEALELPQVRWKEAGLLPH